MQARGASRSFALCRCVDEIPELNSTDYSYYVRHGTLKKQPIFDSDPVMNMECFFDVKVTKRPPAPRGRRPATGDRETPAKPAQGSISYATLRALLLAMYVL